MSRAAALRRVEWVWGAVACTSSSSHPETIRSRGLYLRMRCAIISFMVKGQPITPAQKRRLQAKIRAARTAQAELEAYVLELSDAGVSAQSMEAASGDKSPETHMSHSTLHRIAQRARSADNGQ